MFCACPLSLCALEDILDAESLIRYVVPSVHSQDGRSSCVNRCEPAITNRWCGFTSRWHQCLCSAFRIDNNRLTGRSLGQLHNFLFLEQKSSSFTRKEGVNISITIQFRKYTWSPRESWGRGERSLEQTLSSDLRALLEGWLPTFAEEAV